MLGEEVIEEDIDDDAGEAATFGSEEGAGLKEGGVPVGEAVEGAVHDDAINHRVGIGPAEAVGGTAHEVAEKVSDAGGIGGVGEEDVGEVVQGDRVSGIGEGKEWGNGRIEEWGRFLLALGARGQSGAG